jgi:putative nucleotidyltransferase with HDIG domain
MPTLQQHTLRVAIVAVKICDSLPNADKEIVVIACLFHDMGNIIKSGLPYFPEFIQPEGSAYWEKVKQEYIQK